MAFMEETSLGLLANMVSLLLLSGGSLRRVSTRALAGARLLLNLSVCDTLDRERQLKVPLNEDPTTLLDQGFYFMGRVLHQRTVNPEAFARTMLVAFNPMKKMEITTMGDNKFLFRCAHKGDFNRILDGSPWHYEHHLLVLQEVADDEDHNSMELNHCPFHVQVAKIPFRSYSREFAEMVGNSIGTFMEAELTPEGRPKGPALRLRISLDITQPLIRVVNLQAKDGSIRLAPVTYEKLPLFCVECGMLDHHKRDCETTTTSKEKKNSQAQYGDWLRAKPPRTLAAGFVPPKKKATGSSSSNPTDTGTCVEEPTTVKDGGGSSPSERTQNEIPLSTSLDATLLNMDATRPIVQTIAVDDLMNTEEVSAPTKTNDQLHTQMTIQDPMTAQKDKECTITKKRSLQEESLCTHQEGPPRKQPKITGHDNSTSTSAEVRCSPASCNDDLVLELPRLGLALDNS
ncbi:hypothetical protein M569_07716 [Genlisea aurea]|uniref:DUF4283 domain-containing protein n=1 Tax=Genlisea aurea TaxID=192259 RepID=S8CQB1_9LAMI|nr:hypothetical protein M569_07716 [Genlisea aurea]